MTVNERRKLSGRTRRVLERTASAVLPERSAFELSSDKLVGEWQIPTVDHRASFEVGAQPILFLPVRLETRFKGDELRVRIYPDQVHLDAHQPRLTRAEMSAGQAYWLRRQDGDPDGARDVLVQRLPPRRAVWVASQTRPTGTDATGKPIFATPPLRRGATAGRAALLPERWAIVGMVDNERRFVHFGAVVDQELAFAPSLHDAAAGGLENDPMAWMIDYDQAVAAGMAVTIAMDGFDYGDSGLTLVAVGIGAHDRPRDELERLLSAHHYTEGLSVVPQGTPTNNTDDSIAGWTGEVLDVPGLFARELDGEGVAGEESTSGSRLATAFGLADDSVLLRIDGATIDETTPMSDMNRVLWPVTWGRYLDDLLAPENGESIVPATARQAIKDFFVEHVRGGASLPVLAVGAQPYGILPAMCRDGGDLRSDDPLAALEAILLELKEHWRESLPGVARLDPVDGGTAEDAAAEILGTVPHPLRFIVRRLYWQWTLRTGTWEGLWLALENQGDRFAGLVALRAWMANFEDSVEEQTGWLEDVVDDPSIAGIAPEDEVDAITNINAFLSMLEAHKERQEPINEWYPDAVSGVLDDRVTTDPKIFHAGYGTATDDEIFNNPLVHSEHATTVSYLANLRNRVATLSPDLPSDRAERSIGWQPARLRRGPANRSIERGGIDFPGPIDIPLPLPDAFHQNEPLLFQLIDAVVEDVAPLEGARYCAALDRLMLHGDEELEYRLRETLGLVATRLDAWLTAYATRTLDENRAAGKDALLVGGFGWVEGLRPDGDGVAETAGFIHAPSIAHATTAAVLRAGYQAHGTDDPGSLFAVDLESARVRTAAWLLDGIRQGQALGDLLGCRFERRLHDNGLDVYIDPVRRRVLEAAGITRQPRGPVDGLQLVELYEADGIRIDRADGSSVVVTPDASLSERSERLLQKALDDVRAALDAVADASIADSVHHLLQGNTTRASATLDAVATGAVPPPELRGMDTGAAAAGVTHRVLVLLGREDGGVRSGWSASPRGSLEPALANWAASLMGDPADIVCLVTITELAKTVEVSMLDLAKAQRIGALDALAERASIWAARARAHVLSQPEFAAYEDSLDVELAPELDDSRQTFADADLLAKAARRALGGGQAMDARDLAPPGSDLADGADVYEALARLRTFYATLRGAFDALDGLLPAPRDDDPTPVGDKPLDEVRDALLGLAAVGVGAPASEGYVEAGRGRLYEAAWAAHSAARTKLDAYEALDESASLAARRDALLEQTLPVLPMFTPDASARSVFARSQKLLDDGPAAALDWLQDVARVRADAGRLAELIEISELQRDAAWFSPLVGQLPFVEGEGWVARTAPLDRREPKLCLFAVDAGGSDSLATGGPAAGLVLDTWTEAIPDTDTVTGVAVNYDAPTSRPPQALVLGISPEGREWDFDRVVDTLLDVFESAKLRAVDIGVLLSHGHQAPAVYPPTNIKSGPQEDADD